MDRAASAAEIGSSVFNRVNSPSSGVSWAAVAAGAMAAAALSLVLMVLGTGLGLAAISPWAGEGASAQTVGVASVLWLLFTHIAAAALGGYLAGRLRVAWSDVRADEIYFRDTSHGFLAWALATLLAASLLGAAAGSAMKTTATAAGTAAAGAAATAAGAAGKAGQGSQPQGAAEAGPLAAVTDKLFRTAKAPASGDRNAARAESERLLGGSRTELQGGDREYLAQLVAANTGLSPADAEKRVDEAVAEMRQRETQAREAAEAARKAATRTALGMFLALLVGAFVASLTAVFGGRQRDRAVFNPEMRHT